MSGIEPDPDGTRTDDVCAGCGCTLSSATHFMLAALAEHDLDRAIDLGLLDATPCPGCQAACSTVLIQARDARRCALAARERFRNRTERLARRDAERAARRASAASQPASLPPAAAAALARARARAVKPSP